MIIQKLLFSSLFVGGVTNYLTTPEKLIVYVSIKQSDKIRSIPTSSIKNYKEYYAGFYPVVGGQQTTPVTLTNKEGIRLECLKDKYGNRITNDMPTKLSETIKKGVCRNFGTCTLHGKKYTLYMVGKGNLHNTYQEDLQALKKKSSL